MGTFFTTLQPMLVMFLCMSIGFILNRAKIVPANCDEVLSKVLTYVLVPALIIDTFTKYCTLISLKENATLILYSFLGIALSVVIAFPLARQFERTGYDKKLYQYGFLSANFGFLGNAVVPKILGEAALYPYMLFTLPLNLMCYAWWVNLLVPEGNAKKNGLRNLVNPIFLCLILGVVLGVTGARAHMPEFLRATVGNLAACMGPFAMLLTGFVIGKYPIGQLLTHSKVYLATAFRLVVIPALIVSVLYLCGAGRPVLIMGLFAYATPLGLNTVVFPASYGAPTRTGASMAMISHLACIITIPILYAVLIAILP